MRKLTYMLATVSAAAMAAPVSAQDQVPAGADAQSSTESVNDPTTGADADTGAEILVTAQKRAQRILDVPLSVSVSTQADLERQQVNTIGDLSRVAPALEILQAPGQNVGGGGQIRGIGTQTFNAGAVGAVGITVDGVSQGNANISDLFDIARVEVLKGPQGTLFGLTTSAGVINITTNAPDPNAFSARIRAELSDAGTLGSQYGQQTIQGVINVPVSDTSALRLSGNLGFRQGVNRNLATGDWVKHQNINLRGRWLWEATPDLTVNVIGEYSENDDDGQDFFTIIRSNDPVISAAAAVCGIVIEEGNQDYCSDRRIENHSKGFGGSLQIDYEAGPLVITSISAYRGERTGPGYGDITRLRGNPLQIFSGPGFTQSNLYSQELRFATPTGSRLELTAGMFVSASDRHSEPSPFAIRVTTPFGVIPVVTSLGADSTVKDTSMAAFGQGTYHVTEQIAVLGGARYTTEKLTVNNVSADNGSRQYAAANVDNVSWKVGGLYTPTRTISAYLTASKGYKGPQIAFVQMGTVAQVIRPEIPTNYEAGLKLSVLDNRLFVDLSAFHMKLKDYQGQECTINPITKGLECFQVNIDGVVSKGIELNFSGQPLPGLHLNVGGLYNKVTYPDGYVGNDGSDLTGEQLAYAPKYKFTASGEYEAQISSGIEGFLSADAIYKSKVKTEPSLFPDKTFREHWIVGGRIGVRSPDNRWTVSLFARNLGNVHEPLVVFADPASANAIYGTSSFRQVGISLDMRF